MMTQKIHDSQHDRLSELENPLEIILIQLLYFVDRKSEAQEEKMLCEVQ